MIVQKPQFDVDNIKVGSAYWVFKKVRHYTEIASACIVVGVNALTIDVSFYDVEDERMRTITISINEVVNGVFTLEKMKMESAN